MLCNGKHHVLVDIETPTPKELIQGALIGSFVYCAKRKGTGLQCPYAVKNKKMITGSGYRSLAEQLISFNELGHMPNSWMMVVVLKPHWQGTALDDISPVI